MTIKSINQLATMADHFHSTLESGEKVDQMDLQVFMDNLVTFLEAAGGKVDGIEYLNSKQDQGNVIIHGYIDQLVDNEDGKADNMDSCWFMVPEDWAEKMAKENDWMSLENFWAEYTYDNTVGWLQKAIDDGVLKGCGAGRVHI